MLWAFWLTVVASALGCELIPSEDARPKSPGDNFYRILVNGEVERYVPNQRYVVTLVGSRTHSVVQQFTKFQLLLDPLDPSSPRSPRKQGQFQLFADTLTKFDEECTNSVIESDDLPKTEVQVMWKAPPEGSGCVLFKAMVYENESSWFAQDGQLSKRLCEDAAASAPDCCACDDAKYRMVFEGLWSPQTHPKNFPVQALWLTHFSDVIGATHPKTFKFWGEGEIATDGFRSLAEWGSVGLLERELRQRGPALRSVLKAGGLWHPRLNQNTSAAFVADRKRHLLSLASMFGPSPDWVVGVSGLNLCNKNCTWAESKVIDLFPYDAGTDDGISYMSPNAESKPREKMYRITTMYPEDPRAPFYDPAQQEMQPMARLYLTREKLISRSCDEEVLLSQVAEEVDNADSSGRPECAVGEWGAFSACSVTCGKGLRMRTRAYRMPEKAQMFSCERQLVSKEMCVAAVPECEADSANEAEPDYDVAPVEDVAGVCQTSEWGAWSECSVTCGIGMNTRRRHFLNQMGLKKCPLVHIEENRKCMQPPCSEEEALADVSDPTCPTSDWAAWSPCSASCGRGVRFRTRLLLVPGAQQAPCSARVELMQQRACQERADCAVDVPTAKRICMEAPEQGPCRGLYRRWAFAAAKGMCVPFDYGGCRGNRNNFISQDDCLSTCSVILGGAPAAQGPTVSTNFPGLSVSSIEPAPPASNGAAASDCRLSGWGEWSPCSVTCGIGYQERSRAVLAQPGPGGAPCPERLSRRRRCSRSC
ncbi:spondin-1 isoform X1 [Pararge aegeria]|uniref:spondin-1 isoform X1 n=1 Tax=Pararge aegeria TaxID=116150 RepID=UPI0019D09C08|nr:spondin-1 isoform X1 [Pararge aegeria]